MQGGSETLLTELLRPPGSPWGMSQNPRVPWNTVWKAQGGMLRGLCKQTRWASQGEEGEEGSGVRPGVPGTGRPGRLWDWFLKTEGQEDWSVCESLPGRPALLALQVRGFPHALEGSPQVLGAPLEY